jgi:hypothetical protein
VKLSPAFFLLLGSRLVAQCTAAPASASDSVSITCRAPAVRAEGLARILERVIAANLDADAVLARLDSLAGAAVRSGAEPRTISPEDIARLTRALAPFRGQKVSLGYAGADGETSQLADQLNSILRAAGWVQPTPALPSGATARGESVGIDLTVAERTRASDALWNGLLAAGLDVVAHVNPAAIRDGAISVFVYARR